jgi:Ala-tRNA(Pro) deacylase
MTLSNPTRRPATREELLQRLGELGIATRTVEHPPQFTVADGHAALDGLPGGHTKNLFLKDADGALFLIVALADTKVDLKGLPKRLGCARLSFGKPELLLEVLGVTPGSVTAFAVMNDVAHRVSVVVDAALMAHDTVNCHPLENTATTNIARDDLLRFIRATGHEPRTAKLGDDAAG